MIKKYTKTFLLAAILLLFFSPQVKAQDIDSDKTDLYKEQYEQSSAESIKDYLPQETTEYFNANGIDPSDYNWVNNVSAEGVFLHIYEIFKSGAKKPLAIGAGLMAVILINGALSSQNEKGAALKTADYATVLSGGALLINPVFAVISNTVAVLKSITMFMGAFVPIFAAIVASSGKVATSLSMSTLLLAATNVISYIASFVVVPLLCGYLSLSIASSVSPLVSKTGIAEGVKQIGLWIMSLLSTVFIGILSIQNTVNASADTLTLKTAKFVVGSAVPVAGTALSEALTTVTASMGLLRSSVGIYAVFCCGAIILPFLIELLLWKLMLTVTGAIAELFSQGAIASLIKSINSVITVTIGIILLTAVLFIISLAVVTTAAQ